MPHGAGTRCAGRRPRAGFTLIELMVVLIIIGMASGAALFSWEALVPSQRFNSAVRKLSDVLLATRSEAIARNHEFQIHYDLENDFYAVRTPYRPGGGFTNSERDEDHLWVDRTDLGEEGIRIVQVTIDDVTYDDGVVFVRFDPLGFSSHHTVVLSHDTFDRIHTIEALPLTGEIRFHDGLWEREPVVEEDFD